MPKRFVNRRWFWFLAPLLLPTLWLLPALALGRISLHAPPADPGPDGVWIALVSNGWHVDLAVPLKAAGVDWETDFPASDTGLGGALPYISLGWGDRDFYLETPRLRDLKAKTAVNALLGRGPAVMHVTHLPAMPAGTGVHRLKIQALSYRALAARLRAELQRDDRGEPVVVAGKGFGNSDAFYEAKGHFSPLTTCNEWLAAHLRAVELPAGLWSPLPSGIMDHVP